MHAIDGARPVPQGEDLDTGVELADLREDLRPVILPGELDVDDRQTRLLLGERREKRVRRDVPTRRPCIRPG